MKILLLLGDSGCGKSTVAKYLLNNYDNYYIIKSYTTRKKRDDQDNDHIFTDKETLLTMMFQKEYIASTIINNELYCAFRFQFIDDKICIYIVDDKGLLDVFNYFRNTNVDIYPVRIQRAQNYHIDEERARRNLNQVIASTSNYIYIVDNDLIEECCRKIDDFCCAEKQNIYI